MIAVIAAHPDDEVLGCGAWLARLAEAGEEVFALFLADGVASRGAPAGEIDRRQEMARAASEILGLAPPVFLGLPDNQLDTLPRLELIQAVERALLPRRPRLALTHHPGDLNVDHRLATEAVLCALRPQPGQTCEEILAYEVPSATGWAPGLGPEFCPDTHADAGPGWERKLRALSCYAEEMRPWPHARSMEAVEALARARGALVGCERAEAFVTLRRVLR